MKVEFIDIGNIDAGVGFFLFVGFFVFVFKIRILLRKKYIVYITMPSFNECGFSCVEVPNIAVLVNWETL